jgi:aspartate/methionine/tyrosine aminotransferase
MRIDDFELERFFARYEFAVRHLLCASDVEGWPMADLLELADQDTAALWRDLRLGYTEAPGHPLLRAEIATLYDTIAPDEVLVFSGAEEAIFVAANVLLGPGDHAIVAWPAYQSLHEVARATSAEVTLHELREENGWAIDVDALRSQVTPRTKLIVLNVPNNPTGYVPDAATYQAVAEIAANAGATLLCDEVYRFLERDGVERLRAGADLGPNGVSVGVMSKSFALAGLRIGWMATHDASLLDRATRFKDYTTICASAPAEILSLIALRARDRVLARSRAIVEGNLTLLDAFFERRGGQVTWVRPRGGPVGFPRITAAVPVDRFAQGLLEAEGVLIAPASIFGHPGNNFRLGFGRSDLPVALAGLEAFMHRTLGPGS